MTGGPVRGIVALYQQAKSGNPREGDVVESAWRVLLAAAAWQRRPRPPDAAERAWAVDASGNPQAADPGDEEIVLRWSPRDRLQAGQNVPEAVATLLELYLPLANADERRPLTVGHLGQSIDGHIATANGDSHYVTGPGNILHLHRMRALCDAVIVGAGTVHADDPRLTARLAGGSNPQRVVLDPQRRLAPEYRVFQDGEAPTLLVGTTGTGEEAVPGRRTQVLTVEQRDGRLALASLLRELHRRHLYAVFIEGGGTTVSHFLQDELLDRLQIAVAPLLTGSGRPGLQLAGRELLRDCLRPVCRLYRMGEDVLFDLDLRARCETPDGERTKAVLSRIR